MIVLLNVVGAVLIGAIVWFHWGPRRVAKTSRAGARQEARVAVDGGYSPDILEIEAGRSTRLTFHRVESRACTERVVFDGLGISRDLPTGRNVVIDLPPLDVGEYPFACQMGMVRGKLIVRGV